MYVEIYCLKGACSSPRLFGVVIFLNGWGKEFWISTRGWTGWELSVINLNVHFFFHLRVREFFVLYRKMGKTWTGVLTPGYFEPCNFPSSSIFKVQWWDGRRQIFLFQNRESEKEGKQTNKQNQGHQQVWKPTRANSIWFLRLENNSLWSDAFRCRSTRMVVPPSRCTGLAVLDLLKHKR